MGKLHNLSSGELHSSSGKNTVYPFGESAIIWEVEHYPLENEKGHVLGKNMAILWEAEHHHLGSGTLSSEEEIKILW